MPSPPELVLGVKSRYAGHRGFFEDADVGATLFPADLEDSAQAF
jgi:hypothetical protein